MEQFKQELSGCPGVVSSSNSASIPGSLYDNNVWQLEGGPSQDAEAIMTEVEDVCSALTVMREGRVVFAGTLDELRTRAPRAGAMLRTSDDHAAVACALEHRAVRVLLAPTGDYLEVVAGERASIPVAPSMPPSSERRLSQDSR